MRQYHGPPRRQTASNFLKLSNLMARRGAPRGIKCASCFEFSTAVSYDINKSLHGWRCVKGRSREKANPLRTSGGGGGESKQGMG